MMLLPSGLVPSLHVLVFGKQTFLCLVSFMTSPDWRTRTVEIHCFLVAVVLLMAMQVGPGN